MFRIAKIMRVYFGTHANKWNIILESILGSHDLYILSFGLNY